MFKGRWESKYVNWGITAFCVVCASILFFFLLLKMDTILNILTLILKISMPIMYGLMLAYVMRPIYNRFENRLTKVNRKYFTSEVHLERFARVISITMTLVFMLLIIFLLIEMILPQLVASIYGIIESMPSNLERFSVWLPQLLQDHPRWEKPVMVLVSEITAKMETWAGAQLLPQVTAILANVSLGVIGFFTAMLDVIIGIIVCVYVLNSKVRFCSQGKKLCYAALPAEWAEKVIQGTRFADKVYSGFIGGKLLDSLIIGIICFICLKIMGMPYVMLISIIVGVTNIIPFFGPFIGAVPSAILLLLVDPMKCFSFVVFILILQQVDGNIIGPKILGGSTGLSSFWVIFAILVGGGLFGFPGMVLGVPTFSVIYHFIKYMAEKSLTKKGLPAETERYKNDKPDGTSLLREENKDI